MSEPVPTVGRVLDVVGLVVFLVGAGLYGRAWLGLRHLRETQPVGESARDFAAMARFTELSQTSRTGIWLMVVGGLVAVTAMVVARVVAED